MKIYKRLALLGLACLVISLVYGAFQVLYDNRSRLGFEFRQISIKETQNTVQSSTFGGGGTDSSLFLPQQLTSLGKSAAETILPSSSDKISLVPLTASLDAEKQVIPSPTHALDGDNDLATSKGAPSLGTSKDAPRHHRIKAEQKEPGPMTVNPLAAEVHISPPPRPSKVHPTTPAPQKRIRSLVPKSPIPPAPPPPPPPPPLPQQLRSTPADLSVKETTTTKTSAKKNLGVGDWTAKENEAERKEATTTKEKQGGGWGSGCESGEHSSAVYFRAMETRRDALSGAKEPRFNALRSCNFSLSASEVVVGVFHCMANEPGRLASVAATWAPSLDPNSENRKKGPPPKAAAAAAAAASTLTEPPKTLSRTFSQGSFPGYEQPQQRSPLASFTSSLVPGEPLFSSELRVNLLASAGGAGKGGSVFAPLSLVVTSERKDDYLSTLAKGLLGLEGMYAKNPHAKWFAVVGDDVSVSPENLVRLLSAFNPDQEWCLGDASVVQSRKGLVAGGSAWRLSGGAPIVTSRALTKRLLPHLRRFNAQADVSTVHDLQFTQLMGLHGGGFEKLIHVYELFSQGPGSYLGCPGAKPGSCPKAKPAVPNPSHAPASSSHAKTPTTATAMTTLFPRHALSPPAGGGGPTPYDLAGPRWRPASFHHITTDAYMRFLFGVFTQARACDDADDDDDDRRSRQGELGALRALVILPNSGGSSSPFGWGGGTQRVRRGGGKGVNMVVEEVLANVDGYSNESGGGSGGRRRSECGGRVSRNEDQSLCGQLFQVGVTYEELPRSSTGTNGGGGGGNAAHRRRLRGLRGRHSSQRTARTNVASATSSDGRGRLGADESEQPSLFVLLAHVAALPASSWSMSSTSASSSSSSTPDFVVVAPPLKSSPSSSAHNYYVNLRGVKHLMRLVCARDPSLSPPNGTDGSSSSSSKSSSSSSKRGGGGVVDPPSFPAPSFACAHFAASTPFAVVGEGGFRQGGAVFSRALLTLAASDPVRAKAALEASTAAAGAMAATTTTGAVEAAAFSLPPSALVAIPDLVAHQRRESERVTAAREQLRKELLKTTPSSPSSSPRSSSSSSSSQLFASVVAPVLSVPSASSCAAIISTGVDLGGMKWGLRENPAALTHLLLRPNTGTWQWVD